MWYPARKPEDAIPHESPAAAPSPTSRFLATIKALERAGQRRLVIAVVETWAQHTAPPAPARLAQIRALLDLGMTDRAWTRLQAAPTPDRPEDLSARLALQARLFLDHGWPDRARASVEQLRALAPDDPGLPMLDRALREEPEPLPPWEEHSWADLPRKKALTMVRRALATGALLRAHQLLDHFHRRWPDDPTLTDLRWALQGDYILSASALEELLHRWGGAGHVKSPGHEDPTEEVPHPPADAHDAPSSVARRAEASSHDAETTQRMRLADLFGQDGPPTAGEDLDEEDTQMRRVLKVNPSPTGSPAPPTFQTRVELEPEDDEVVVLRDRRRAIGPAQTRLPPLSPDEAERLPMPRGKAPEPPGPSPSGPARHRPSSARPRYEDLSLLLALAGGALLAMASAMFLFLLS